MRVRRTLAAVVGASTLLVTAACGSDGDGAGSSAGATSGDGVTGTVTVLAAASLTESFTTLGKQFEAAHPGVTVTFSFAASSALAEQANSGAPADVFASASKKNMTAVVDKGNASDPVTFVTNVMAIAVPPDNPAGITGVADLAKSGVKVALCAKEVPCGATAEKVFANANVSVTPVSYEEDVKATLTKVELKEVDAGVVYVTDVKAAGDKVKGIEIPADVNASTEYPIATLKQAPNPTAAKAFVDYVLSDQGQQVLTAAGFESP